MECAGTATRMRGDLGRRAAPIAGGGALAAAAALIATHDPAAPGAHFPGCPFHRATGLWCPGCGLTRGTYQLLHGHIGAALGYNVFTPLALAVIIVAWLEWLRQSWGAPPMKLTQRSWRWLAPVMPSSIIAYGVLRNLPVAPLRALAP